MMLVIRRLLFLSTLLLFSACGNSDYDEAKQLYERSRESDSSVTAEFADPLGRAIELLEGFLSRNHEDPAATLLLWRCYSRTGNPRATAMRESMLTMPEAMRDIMPREIRREHDDYMRAQMVDLLGGMAAPSETKFFVGLMENDPATGVQQASVKVLAQLRNQQALSPLLKKLTNGNDLVRASVARALAAYPRAEVAEALQLRMADNRENPEVRGNAGLALAEIGGLNPGLWHDLLPKFQQLLGDPGKSLSTRLLAAMILAKRGNASGHDLALQNADIEDAFTRGLAIVTLGLTGNEKALSAIVAAAQDSNWKLRYQAAEALGDLSDPKGLPALYKAKDDPNEFVRQAARAAIEKIKGKAGPRK